MICYCLCQGKGESGSPWKIPRLSVRQADALGDNGIQRQVTAWLHLYLQEESTLGELTDEGACQVSCMLNQVQLLNDNVKEGKSGICSGKDRKSPEKVL